MKRVIGSVLMFLMVSVGTSAEEPLQGVPARSALERVGVEPSWFVSVLREVLQDDHFDVVDAQRTLRRKGFDPSAIAKKLAEALYAQEETVRRDAALMLVRLGSAAFSVRDTLERVAEHDNDPVVRDYARMALNHLVDQATLVKSGGTVTELPNEEE